MKDYNIGDSVIFEDDNTVSIIKSRIVNLNPATTTVQDTYLYLVSKNGVVDWYSYNRFITLNELRKLKIEKLYENTLQ